MFHKKIPKLQAVSYVLPNVTTKIQFNEKGEIMELFILVEFKINEQFFSGVQKKRKEKTR